MVGPNVGYQVCVPRFGHMLAQLPANLADLEASRVPVFGEVGLEVERSNLLRRVLALRLGQGNEQNDHGGVEEEVVVRQRQL